MKAIRLGDKCLTDHCVICSNVTSLMSKTRHSKGSSTAKYDLVNLNTTKTLGECCRKLTECLKDIDVKETEDVESWWTELKEKITSTCDETLCKVNRYHEVWFHEYNEEISRLTN